MIAALACGVDGPLPAASTIDEGMINKRARLHCGLATEAPEPFGCAHYSRSNEPTVNERVTARPQFASLGVTSPDGDFWVCRGSQLLRELMGDLARFDG
jgi:hypothetical protein